MYLNLTVIQSDLFKIQIVTEYLHTTYSFHFPSAFWHCSKVGWHEGHPACKKVGCSFVVMIWLELCSITAPVVTAISIILLAATTFSMDTFWYWLTQVHLEKWPLGSIFRVCILIWQPVARTASVAQYLSVQPFWIWLFCLSCSGVDIAMNICAA